MILTKAFNVIQRAVARVLHGGSFCVIHTDANGTQRSRHWCDTWQDALEWAACSLKDDVVTIRNCHGVLMARRWVTAQGE